MLTPIFAEASDKFTGNTKVAFVGVDCDRQTELAQRYHINKYPTLKLFRFGQVAKREYRGQRSAEALAQHIESQLEIPIKEFNSYEDLAQKIDNKKRNIIAYFGAKVGTEWDNFQRVASNLKDDCGFWVGTGDVFKQETLNGNHLSFRPPNTYNQDQAFTGTMGNAEYLRQWVGDKCIPLVREITFENAEELTEEGLPFLILFRHPDDNAIVETYTQEVARLTDQKSAVNFLYADGKKFAHPLHHLGKSERDLPLLAIDSFRHMYLFPDMKDLTVPGKLQQFLQDLHSGKLHREFHHGPDPQTADQPVQPSIQMVGPDGNVIVVPAEPQVPTDGQQRAQPSSPPVSIFEKLKPSENRYTILRDEL